MQQDCNALDSKLYCTGIKSFFRKGQTALIQYIRKWKERHPDLWEFILFNLLSNCATITNFVVLWISGGLIFRQLDMPFHWLIFDYTSPDSGGLGGFLSFLLAYICAQCVNYVVQRKWVFGATVAVKKTIGWYILTVTVAGMISVALPGYLVPMLTPYVGGAASTIANMVNIGVQVVVNYPMLKFVIMKSDSEGWL